MARRTLYILNFTRFCLSSVSYLEDVRHSLFYSVCTFKTENRHGGNDKTHCYKFVTCICNNLVAAGTKGATLKTELNFRNQKSILITKKKSQKIKNKVFRLLIFFFGKFLKDFFAGKVWRLHLCLWEPKKGKKIVMIVWLF